MHIQEPVLCGAGAVVFALMVDQGRKDSSETVPEQRRGFTSDGQALSTNVRG